MLRVCTGELTHDSSHIRHLFEALHAHPEVEVVSPGDDPDVNFVGPGRLRVRMARFDPEFLHGEVDLIHPFVEGALRATQVPGFEGHVRYVVNYMRTLERQQRSKGNVRLAEIDKADLWCPLVAGFYDEYISPHLSHAKIFPLPFSVPSRLFYCDRLEDRPYDAFWVGNQGPLYPLRDHMIKTLRATYPKKHPNVTFYVGRRFRNGAKPGFRKDYRIFDAHQTVYASCLRQSRMIMFGPGLLGLPLQRYVEAMASGCLVLSPMPLDSEALGFVDGKTMVAVDRTNFMDKFNYYLEHEDERQAIAKKAHALVQRRYTCEAQANFMVQTFTDILAGTPVEDIDWRST